MGTSRDEALRGFAASLLEKMNDAERVTAELRGKEMTILIYDAPVLKIVRRNNGFYAKAVQPDRNRSWAVCGLAEQQVAATGWIINYLEERLAELGGCRP